MSDKTALGDRMKAYEIPTKQILPRRTYTILRVDIRAAHTLLRNATRPFDLGFMQDMNVVAEKLVKEISGSAFAYTQSDEISVLITDFKNLGTQPWFGGVVAKMTSISASIATAALNSRGNNPRNLATFDSRVFTMTDPYEVANYFLWRQRDAVRNSISMAAQAHFSHKELQGVSTGLMQEMLWSQKSVNWNAYPDSCKRGRVTSRKPFEMPISWTGKDGKYNQAEVVRNLWVTEAAPHFVAEDGNWLAEQIPVMESFKR